jgi:alpha-methylacyl-CoA racemase
MLNGVTVLDLSTVGPAARAARMLADYGARVVKVGAPVAAGSQGPSGPSERGALQIEPPFFAYGGHRGMQRVRLDLKSDEGRAEFLRLAGDADVVMESFRPGVVDRLGVGFEAVQAVNPDVVYCATSGYGQDGPKSQWAGHDLNYLAAGGYFACAGRGPDGEPTLPGATVADIAAGGMQAVVAILAALVGRADTGEGAYLDVSVADGVVGMLALLIDEHLATGVVPGPGHDILTGRYACYGLYRCADDEWVAVGAIEPKFYANLCRLLGCEQWIAHQNDDDVQDHIRTDFAAAFARRTRDDWVAELGPADTCVAPVNGIDEVVADAQVLARGDVVEAVRPSGETFRQVAAVWAGAPRPDRVEVREPGFDDSDDLLN